jgi:hypothetical protein
VSGAGSNSGRWAVVSKTEREREAEMVVDPNSARPDHGG